MSTNLETIFSQTLQSKLQNNKTLDLRKVAKKAITEEVRREIESLADEFGGILTANNIIPFTKKIKSIGGDTQQLDITKGDTSDTEATKLESAVIKTFVKKEDKSELTLADLVNPNLKLVTSPDIENDMVSTIPSLSIEINPSQQTQQSTGTSSASKTVDLTFSPDEQRSILTLTTALVAKSANIGDPLKEGEVLLSNFLEVLDRRFLVSSLFSPLRSSFRDNVDVNILPYVIETFTLQAANYIGGLVSRLPQGASLDANDRMFGGALPELKELLKGGIASAFDLKQFKEIVEKNINKGSENSKKLIDEILSANPKTKGQVVDLIRNHAMNLKDPKEKDALLSAFGLNIPELMVNYMLQRMTKVFSERTKSVEAANNIANARWDKTRDAINKIYS